MSVRLESGELAQDVFRLLSDEKARLELLRDRLRERVSETQLSLSTLRRKWQLLELERVRNVHWQKQPVEAQIRDEISSRNRVLAVESLLRKKRELQSLLDHDKDRQAVMSEPPKTLKRSRTSSSTSRTKFGPLPVTTSETKNRRDGHGFTHVDRVESNVQFQTWSSFRASKLEVLASNVGSTRQRTQLPHAFRSSTYPFSKLCALLDRVEEQSRIELVSRAYDCEGREQALWDGCVVFRPMEVVTSREKWVKRSFNYIGKFSIVERKDTRSEWSYEGQYQRWPLGVVKLGDIASLLDASDYKKLVSWLQLCCFPRETSAETEEQLKTAILTRWNEASTDNDVVILGYRYVGWDWAVVRELKKRQPRKSS